MSDFDIVQKDGIYMDRKPLKIGDLTARIPVIQGGMGVGISLSHLAGSVAANGGVGILSAAQIGFREPDFEEHPKEAGGIILGLLATLGITNFIQWRKRRKEQKRHEEVENLQKDALKKHDAQIRNYKELSEENGYLKKLNSSLCEALVESSEGGESDNEE